MNKFTKQCVAAFASLAMAGTLCVAGVVVTNNVAFATSPAAASTDPAPWDKAATNKTGSILIHKTDDAAKPKGLNNVTFTIKKVAKLGTGDSAKALDLTKQDDWVTLASKVGELNAAAQAGNPGSKVTFDTTFNTSGSKSETTKNDTFDTNDKVDGVANFTDLPLGLYYVAETKVEGDAAGYSPKFSPFFITVPEITRGATDTNNKYNYIVKVSPKNWNATEGIKKDAVTGDIVGVGDTLPYKITAKVTLPADADKTTESTGSKKVEYFAGSNINGFKIWDDALIDAYDGMSEASYIPDATVTVGEYDAQSSSFKTIANTTNPETLNNGDDYNVTVSNSDVDKTGDTATRKRILFEFTEAGRNKIAKKFGTNANTDIRVQVTLKFKLKSTYGAKNTETVLENKYGFNPGGKGNVPDITGKTTETKLHKFHIFKYDGTTENSTKKPLPNAQFKVFTESKKAAADTCAKNPDGKDACSGAMTGFVDAQSTTAGETGTITTTGKDGKTADYVAKEGEKFYVVEIKAPDGFARSEKVYEVTVTAKKDNDTSYEYAIANVPSNDGDFWFKLPKTGAYGIIIFAIAGMCLVAVGMFIFLRNRKKDEEQQSA